MTERAHDTRVVARAPGTSLPSALVAWCVARRHALVVWGAMTVWSAALFAIARSDYVGFRFGRFDLGNMVQAISSTSHGRPLDFTNVWGDQVSRLGSHVDPILALFAPFWASRRRPSRFSWSGSLSCPSVRSRSSGLHAATSPPSGSRCSSRSPTSRTRGSPGRRSDRTRSRSRSHSFSIASGRSTQTGCASSSRLPSWRR